jgi:predicted AAA+ superfamily ATPase
LLVKYKVMFVRKQLKNIKNQCFKGKVILLLGARQVGKTTLLQQLIKNIDKKSVWFNADEADILNEFTQADTSTRLLQLIGNDTKLAIIDEAQQIPNIGKKLKLLCDNKPELQIIATGSSSFDLLNNTNEPLTGRKRVFQLFPISYNEIVESKGLLEAKRTLNNQLIYGSYPEVISNPGKEKEVLLEIASSYLYKDILMMDGIRKSSHLEKLLQALAFQVGNEVNYHELSKTIGNIDTATVEKYLDLLEKTFVIFKLPALSRNLRNEIKKGKKYYFVDNGIRNVLISNYNPIDLRIDKGALWENYIISERRKFNHYENKTQNTYFWRTHDQAEIDYIEETGGSMYAYEIKWNKEKSKFPTSFINAYPTEKLDVVNNQNFENFLRIE